MIKNYYDILGVSQNASEDEIKRAFKDCAKKYHPDVSKLPNAHQKFVEIGEAYEVLSDERSRRDYDNILNAKEENKSGFDRTSTSSSYNDFESTQQQAREQARNYAAMNLDDLVTNVLGFVYTI